MRSLILGNGINIQFGNKAYTSDFIIKRAYVNAIQGKYASLFANEISNEELGVIIKSFITVANKIINCEFDYVTDYDLKNAIEEFKSRYLYKIDKYSQIMLEDWFLLLRVFFVEHSDVEEQWQSAKQGFEQIFLDAIYNDGNLEKVYTNIPKKVSKYIKGFDKIFTLNYDSNVENLIKKQVFHLHGSYSTLADSENDKTVFGYMRYINGEQVFQADRIHCFCNALLDYSGSLKMKKANNIEKLQNEIIKFRDLKQDNLLEYESTMIQLKEKDENSYNVISAAVNNETLFAGTSYHFEDLKALTGELTIIGISPNNDAHIFESINNSNVNMVYFYNWGNLDVVLPINKPYQILDVNELWNSLDARKKVYSNSITLPNDPKLDDYLNLLDSISLDKEPKEKMISELKTIPQFEIERLCKTAIDIIKHQKADGSPKTEKDLLLHFSVVSSFALREGILPKTLFLLVLMNFSKYN